MRRKFMRPRSIRARMTLGFSAFASLLMLGVCAAFFIYTKLIDRRDADSRLALAKQEIQRELSEGEHSLSRPVDLVREENDDLRAADVALLIRDAKGQTVAQSQRENPHWPPYGDAWRTISFPSGSHTILVGVEWQSVEEALRERTQFLLILSMLVVALSSAGAWFLVGRTLSPIDLLARQAKTASADSLQLQLESPSLDVEMLNLVATLNELLARLGRTVAMRGRFYAAASHELRTPLQALTGHLEVALSRTRPAEQYWTALMESHTQANRLTTLVQDLLLLNQLDAATSRPPCTEVDLSDLCSNEFRTLRALAERRGLMVEFTLPEQFELLAPWNHATMLVRNLLENAVKYATPGGKVQVQLTGDVMTICNDHEPEEAWEADKYFEPFFRPDASRNSETGGNGLGLAIAKALADANGWSLELNQNGAVICATVVFRPDVSVTVQAAPA